MRTERLPSGSMVQNNKGMSLIEVIAALMILTLMVAFILRSFSYPASWLRVSQENNQAANYAASLLDLLQSHAPELKEQLEVTEPWVVYDEQPSDQIFNFVISGENISCAAPANMQARVTAAFYDDSFYYMGLAEDGIPVIFDGERAEKIIFFHNLIELDIDIKPVNSPRIYEFSTIIGAR